MRKLLLPVLVPAFAPLLLLAIWQVAAVRVANQIILPSMMDVLHLIIHPTEDLLSMGSLLSNLTVSLARVMAGYLLAVVLAVTIGITMGYYRPLFRTFSLFFALFRPIPPLAWVPLVLAWFGVASFATMAGLEYGQWYMYLNNLKISMVFIIFIGGFYPVLTSTIQGVQSVRTTLLDSARVLGAGEMAIFTKVLLPAAAPAIVTGMRIGLGVAWMCLVSAEMLPGSLSGIGYLITHAFTVARTDVVIAGMISIGVVGAAIDFIFRLFEERTFSWQRRSR